ncbi:MAG: hypothetical protein D8M57_13270 [Candidatus Scalindua sp. AMX11]|nr:MAG: hypothetical protein DWQ00_11820 [Candidatus Scalindua sp.]NOG83754.1 hypothetical protein [Planctomycetota bacterium]RZV82913.1 MAG: hypothetical protein EX341_08975 [Candidatus Scalindua sp. SCAELEC01]TDE64465.1 MAG: hypothetical protein D8M57_13270 [Candidatus Scalindua sp. AMX11]GJQ59794.1 MAG: hypothetical protein SCALA701_25950 [Candidatus Scalindua sp.]
MENKDCQSTQKYFDPSILNFTLKAIQKSIDDLKTSTDEKFKHLNELIMDIQEENKIISERIIKVDKEFSICRASRTTAVKTNSSRNALLFKVLTIVAAAGALFISACTYFKKGGG